MSKVKDPSCDPKYILQNLGALKEDANKLEYISEAFVRCAIAPSTKKKKRKGMSGYNCFSKVMYKKEQKNAELENRKSKTFMDILQLKGWTPLDQKQKETWDRQGKEGCLPRLWEY